MDEKTKEEIIKCLRHIIIFSDNFAVQDYAERISELINEDNE